MRERVRTRADPDSQSRRPGHLDVIVAQHGFDELHPLALPHDSGLGAERRDGHGPHQVDGQAPAPHRHERGYGLDDVREECRYRAAVLVRGIPRSLGEVRRDVRVAVGDEQRAVRDPAPRAVMMLLDHLAHERLKPS